MGRILKILLLLLGLGAEAASAAGATALLPDSMAVLRWLHRADSVAATSPAQALAWQDSAQRLAQARHLPRLEVRALLASGATAAELANYPAAATAGLRAWALARRLDSPSADELAALRLLAGVAFSRDRFAEARDYARQALAVAQALGNEELLLDASGFLGNALSENQQYREAGQWLRQAQAGNHRRGRRKDESIDLVNLSVNELYQARLPTALAYANAALRAARRQPDSLMVSNALSARARVYREQKRPAAALVDYQQAMHLAEASGKPEAILVFTEGLGTIYEEAGRLPEALAAERRNYALKDSFNSADVARQMAELNTRFRVGQQQARISTLTQQQRIAALSAERESARARLWSLAALALAVLLASGGWLLRQVRRSRAQLLLSDAELRAANRVKDQANATKDQVMRIIGHDLREPLATFEQFGPELAELADAPDPAEQHILATALSDRARAVRELVDNLLNWARVQTGDLAVLPQPVRPAVVAQSLERVFGPLAAAKGVVLRVACAPDVPTTLLTDPNLLGAVLRNLLGNAIRFTPAGGEVRLDIAAGADGTASGAAARITIADTGRGMGPVQLAAALGGQPVDSINGINGEPGTGLGLAVVRHFAGLLRADWRGESEPGRGTRWTLGLPAVG